MPPDFTDQSSSKANCSVPTALPQLPPPFVIRAIALLTHVGLAVKCLSSLTTLSNKNSSYPTSEYLPPICLISEYGNLFRYSYPLTQESRPQLLGSLSPGVSQTHSIGNSILSSTTDSSLWFHSECTLFAHRLFVFNFYGLKISTLLSICQFYFQNLCYWKFLYPVTIFSNHIRFEQKSALERLSKIRSTISLLTVFSIL